MDAICQSTQSVLQSPEKENVRMSYEKKIQVQSLTNAPEISKNPLFHSVSGFGSLRKPPPLLIPNSSDYDGGEGMLTFKVSANYSFYAHQIDIFPYNRFCIKGIRNKRFSER